MARNRRVAVTACLGLLILAIGPLARTFAVQSPTKVNRVSLPGLPGCESLNGWSAEWTPTFAGPDYVVADSYRCDGYTLHVRLVQYVEQHQGKEAVGELNSVIPRTWWNATTRSLRFVEPDLEVDEYRVEGAPRRLTIWNWYAVGLHPAASGFGVKALEALNALRLRSSATTNFTVAVEADTAFDPTTVLRRDASYLWKWFRTEAGSR